MKREEGIMILKELLDSCSGLDGHSLELTPPSPPSERGYQIMIRTALDQKTMTCIKNIITEHQLSYQSGSMWKTKHSLGQEPDTFIIYKPKKRENTRNSVKTNE